ncbi:hypothetical protein [Dyadobacter psychrotolerans]|uniref:Uncharacterized protein n=1 Tax=Dyadobacter psychrotolerans TaxID=2541721 RepID=A0A4R5E084_9BACT|nr:hypothetical protein [Dyadobacter psychrotolerans]TDE18394.1 hypothetical protein E0F88_02315 [Dyadobacter psychrotolerans]
METLVIEIQNPEARRLIDNMVDLGLISVKSVEPSWKERWKKISDSLPPSSDLSDEDIMSEIDELRSKRVIS